MRRREEKKEGYKIKIINIQGLTNEKYTELQEELKEKTILCMTETQKKVDNIKRGEKIGAYSSMRQKEEKKGGGIMVMFEEKDGLEVEEVNIVGKNSDWMMVRVKEGGEEWKVAVVYLGTGGGGETLEKNKIILREIGIEVRKAEREEETVFVVGDFNGHLGYIGYQEENENGKLINEFMSENDLILMNCDEKCEGLYTWERQEMKSVIDLIFTNMRGYGKIKKIKIDEQRERVDLSDHCLIEVQLKGKHMDKANWRLGEIREGYSRKKEKLLIFSNKIEEKIREEGIGIALERINRIMKETAEEELKN